MTSSKGKARAKRPDGGGWLPRRAWILAALAAPVALGLVLLFLREDPQHLLHKGEALLDRDPHEAARLLERSVTIAGGDFPPAQLLLCLALGKQGRWVEALGCYSLIKDTSACDGRRLMELAAAASAGGEPILAEQALEAARMTSVPEADVLRALVPVRLELSHDEQALADCRRLAVLAPDGASPHLTEARLLRRRRDVLAATSAYRAALANTKDPAELAAVRRELVEVLVQQGNAQEARRELDQLGPPEPTDEGRPLLAAHVLRLEGRSREALDQVQQSLAAHPDQADALLLCGTIQFDLGEYDRAAAVLQRLVKLDPFHNEAHYLLGQTLLKLGRAAEATSHLETSQRLAAMAEEIRSLEGRVARDPRDARLMLRLAELYEATGRPDVGARWREAAARVGTN